MLRFGTNVQATRVVLSSKLSLRTGLELPMCCQNMRTITNALRMLLQMGVE